MPIVGIFRTRNTEDILTVEQSIITVALQTGMEIKCYNALSKSIQSKECDVLVTLGGDGTILKAVHLLDKAQLPVLAVAMGKLGFLAEVGAADLVRALSRFQLGDFTLESRNLMQVNVFRQHQWKEYHALNEIVVKSTHSRMIEVDTYINDQFCTMYKADGVIVATPTGSTAYNLSAGGPLISPTLNAMVLSPVSPHALTVRALVIPDEDIVTIVPKSLDTLLSIDGQIELLFDSDSQVKVTRSAKTVYFVRFEPYNFFNAIRNKLHWSGANSVVHT